MKKKSIHSKGKMEILNTWLAAGALFIALIGGIPGLIEVFKYFQEKPNLQYQLVEVGIGPWSSPTNGMIFITGTVSNPSEKPIVPSKFDLEIFIDNKWSRLEPVGIPPGMQFNSQGQKIEYNNISENDLQKSKIAITSSTPIYGHLLFRTIIPQSELVKVKKFRLRCIDVLSKNYIMEFVPDFNSNNSQEPVTSPKHGFTVTPKLKDSLN